MFQLKVRAIKLEKGSQFALLDNRFSNLFIEAETWYSKHF